MTYFTQMDSPLGVLTLIGSDGQLQALNLPKANSNSLPTTRALSRNDAALSEAVRQLREYFDGKRRDFDLPLAPNGTPFQQTVWQSLQHIPFGQTWSYKALAETIGKPKAMRAVGLANGRNPIPIIIPCHRVIGANGKLVGYSGGLDIKIKLLALEGDKVQVR